MQQNQIRGENEEIHETMRKTSSTELIPLKLITQLFLPGIDRPFISLVSLITSFAPSRILSHLFPG